MKYNVEYIFQASQKEARKPNPSRFPWKMWSKRGDFCRLCTPGYSSLRLEYSLRGGVASRAWASRERKTREREVHAFVRPLAASFARQKWRACSQATPIVFRYVRDTSAPQDDALLACLLALSSYLENIISDLLLEIFFIKLGRGGKAPTRLASQASLASFWGFFLLTIFNIFSWKIDFFSHGDNSLRFLLQNFPSQALQLAPLVNDYLL